MKSLLLVGAGGHCASCIEVIESTHSWEIAGLVDVRAKIGESLLGYKITGSDEDLPALAEKIGSALITVGQISSSAVRKKLYNLVRRVGFSLPAIVASTAVLSRHGELGPGSILMHHGFINAGARVGGNCILNTGCIVEHDAVVGDNCHISTGARVNGECMVGEDCFVGSGAVLRHGIKIAPGCIIGAGAVVVSDINEAGMYAGCPVKRIK